MILMSLSGTNKQIDLQNPDNLAAQSTEGGTVPNLKWSLSDSKAKIFNGGWTREQVITDLPSSHDIAAAQQNLKKGGLRELHWHRVVGRVYTCNRTCPNADRLSGATCTLAQSWSRLLMKTVITKSISLRLAIFGTFL